MGIGGGTSADSAGRRLARQIKPVRLVIKLILSHRRPLVERLPFLAEFRWDFALSRFGTASAFLFLSCAGQVHGEFLQQQKRCTMVRKLVLAAVAAIGVSLAAGGVAQAGGGHHGHGHHGHGHRSPGHHGPAHRYGYGHRGHYRGGVVISRPVYPYPVYPSYPVYGPAPVYGYPPVYSPYNSAVGVNTGNFSLFLAR